MRDLGSFDVCVIGLGPAGIGAALTFMKSGWARRVICIDAGRAPFERFCRFLPSGIAERVNRSSGDCCLDSTNYGRGGPCQIISGFGGCSLTSGGKVSLFPAGSGLTKILGSKQIASQKIMQAFRVFSEWTEPRSPDITDHEEGRRTFEQLGFEFKYYDAYEFDQEQLRKVYQGLIDQLLATGVNVSLNCTLTDVSKVGDDFRLVVNKDNESAHISAQFVVIAVGRLGRGLVRSLNSKLGLEGAENHLDVGVRLEFPTAVLTEATRFHNDLKLLFGGARTFCVCKDGILTPYFLDGAFFTEGYHSLRIKSGLTNLAITVRISPSEENAQRLQAIRIELLKMSEGKPIRQLLTDYLGLTHNDNPSNVKSSITFFEIGEIDRIFGDELALLVKKAVEYFVSRLLPREKWDQVSVYAPEVDYGGLVFSINRDFSVMPGFYLIGDCTGRFRGILQALCSGIVCAEGIVGGNPVVGR